MSTRLGRLGKAEELLEVPERYATYETVPDSRLAKYYSLVGECRIQDTLGL